MELLLFNFQGSKTTWRLLLIIEKEQTRRYGGVAQLGEHLPCKQGVMGSNPIISTSGSAAPKAPHEESEGSSN